MSCNFNRFWESVPYGTPDACVASDDPAHPMTGNVVLSASPGVVAMKTIVSALIALSVLAGVAAPASALDAKTFYAQMDRASY